MQREFTLDERTEMSRAFDRGNYANAYESDDLETFESKLQAMPAHMRAAFILGYFASFELDEIPGYYREIFDECYWSDAGRYVVHVAGYCDDRADEYKADEDQWR